MGICWRSRRHCCRFNKAKEQYDQDQKAEQKIYEYTKECLMDLGLDTSKIDDIEKVKKKPPYDKSFYQNLQIEFCLEDERDIIWMKFTKKGHLGVVAISSDINFDIPSKFCEYLQQKENGNWVYNFSGVLIKYLNQEWNEEYVLVFPLVNISSKLLTRKKVERKVGDYLLNKGVPILDFYSHRI